MASITIPFKLWFRLADIVQDMGNHHPLFRDTDIGRDLDVLGTAIKFCVPPSEGALLGVHEQLKLDAALAVVAKHGGGRDGLTSVEQCIETAEKLLGLWAE